MADLIETFCRLHVPEAFDDDAAPVDNSKRDGMVAAIADILRADGRCSPHELRGQFSNDDIERYWDMAYGLACVSLNIKEGVS